MSHPDQMNFFALTRKHLPSLFEGVRVIEVGSLDINGSIRGLFNPLEYVGVDLEPGKGVDHVCPGQLLEFPSGYFDVVVSTECFEHNPFWVETLSNMLRMMRPSGAIVLTFASRGRPEHGTHAEKPGDSPFTINKNWNYYRNLSEKDLSRINLPGWLKQSACVYNPVASDLYFIGLGRDSELVIGDDLRDELTRALGPTRSARALAHLILKMSLPERISSRISVLAEKVERRLKRRAKGP